MSELDKTNHITPSNAQTALVDLTLDAVALCGAGANSRADIILTKGKEKVTMPKTYDELLKALQPEQADVFTKHVESLLAAKDTEIAKLTSEVTELKSQVETLGKSAKEQAEGDVLKNASPEIRALLEKQQATIDGLVAARSEDLAKSRFEKCKALPCDETELKDVLKTASPAVVSILEKAAAAIEEKVLTAKGRDTDPAFTSSSAEDQYAKLEKSAKALMEEHPGMTFEKAFCEAASADPETYRKYTEGVN